MLRLENMQPFLSVFPSPITIHSWNKADQDWSWTWRLWCPFAWFCRNSVAHSTVRTSWSIRFSHLVYCMKLSFFQISAKFRQYIHHFARTLHTAISRIFRNIVETEIFSPRVIFNSRSNKLSYPAFHDPEFNFSLCFCEGLWLDLGLFFSANEIHVSPLVAL